LGEGRKGVGNGMGREKKGEREETGGKGEGWEGDSILCPYSKIQDPPLGPLLVSS